MDIGRDVLTRTLIGSTESEKVFTPWWVTLHHYLVYILVILGLIALPVNCMLSVIGNCAYKVDHVGNYLLPFNLCNANEESEMLLIEKKFSSHKIRQMINSSYQVTEIISQPVFEYHKSSNAQAIRQLKHTFVEGHDTMTNSRGCLVKANPKLFEFFIYYKCVNRLSAIALYFPYLVLTLALILVLLERMLTRYLWTGQRIETFYNLLVKDVLASGDIDVIDTKENRQKCQRILYDFRNSRFYCQAYVGQTAVKLCICLAVFIWSLFDQCNSLRESFRTEFDCKVYDYVYECSIPSNGMNLAIFDLCNAVLFVVVVVAAFNMAWHLRFYTQKNNDNNLEIEGKGLKKCKNFVPSVFSPKLTWLVYNYQESKAGTKADGQAHCSNSAMEEIYCCSPDMQMLLNLLVETEGIWAAILILSLFDGKFKNEFKVRDSEISSSPSGTNPRRKDVAIAWNEPMAAHFIGQNVPTEHLMYVLEIDPPVDNETDEAITLMPACRVDGACVFNRIRKLSPMADNQFPVFSLSELGRMTPNSDSFSRRTSSSSSLATSSSSSTSSRKSSQSTSHLVKTNPDNVINIVDGGAWSNKVEDPGRKLQRKLNSLSSFHIMNKNIVLNNRSRKSDEKIRNFRTTFEGLRLDTDYVIRISFVLSGRKLGSESYTILSPDPYKMTSDMMSCASNSPYPTPRTSTTSAPSQSFERKNSTNLFSRSGRHSLSHDDHMQPTLLEEDSYESLQNENSDISQQQNRDSNISEHSDTLDSDTSIYELMSRRGFFYIAHSTFQLNSALRESPTVRKEKDRIVVLEFVARWCGLCRFIEPQLERLSEECHMRLNSPEKNVIFIRADIDDCSASAKEFGIEVLPSVILIEQQLQENGGYNEGLVLDVHIGQRVDNIREGIQAWFQGDNQGKQEKDESPQGKNVENQFSFAQDRGEKEKGPN